MQTETSLSALDDPPQAASFSQEFLRADDLLYVRFEFFNLTLKTSLNAPPHLVRSDSTKAAYIVVHFPPQNIQEQTVLEPEGGFPPGQTPNPAIMSATLADSSRLAFLIPAELTQIPYTLKALLNWAAYLPSLTPTALPSNPVFATPDARPAITEPTAVQTAIEAPYRLILSPNEFGGWSHALGAVTHAGRTELWHTRLGVLKDGGPLDEQGQADLRTVRAVWSPDFGASAPAETNELHPLNALDRYNIVRLTSDFRTGPGGGQSDYFKPLPVQVNRLMLTSQGAWLDLHGQWNPQNLQTGLSREEWQQISTLGRDHYVKVVQQGYLFPFGHRAVLTKISERKFHRNADGSLVAYLFQREFITVRQPLKTYGATGYLHSGREMPLKSIEITTLVTPNLDRRDTIGSPNAFWIKTLVSPTVSQDFKFHLVATDLTGQKFDFTATLIFVKVNDRFATNPTNIGPINTVYVAHDDRRKCAIQGHRVAFAPSVKNGDTTFNTEALYFEAQTLPPPEPDSPAYLPALSKADVHIPAVEHLIGQDTAAPIKIKLFDPYLNKEFDPAFNQGQVFAELLGAQSLDFPADKAGGLLKPAMNIVGVSRLIGPVSSYNPSPGPLSQGTFDPANFFKDVKLLGGLLLADIVKRIEPASFGDGSSVPKLLTEIVKDAGGQPTAIRTSFDWHTGDLKDNPIFTAHTSNGPAKLSLSATVLTPLRSDPAQPGASYQATGELSNFSLTLVPGFEGIEIDFNKFRFETRPGTKTQVTTDIADIKFINELAFVDKLKDYIPKTGGDNEPSIEISLAGVTVGFKLAIPNIAVGVFSLQGISFSSQLSLSFEGKPTILRIGFSERQHPFLLVVSLFGGGGFFALSVSTDGTLIVEAALEFGASVSLDFGVASGGVYVMAGIYFKTETGKGVQLTGFFRCGGSVEVLGIASVSIEFYLGLTYDSQTGKVTGEASVTLEVEVLFFSASVSFTVRKSFGGSAADPTFGELIEPDDWTAYCLAFA